MEEVKANDYLKGLHDGDKIGYLHGIESTIKQLRIHFEYKLKESATTAEADVWTEALDILDKTEGRETN